MALSLIITINLTIGPYQNHYHVCRSDYSIRNSCNFITAKYPDPWKGGGRLYRKRLTDLATMVTETLIWEKSKQYKKTKGSSSALFSNN